MIQSVITGENRAWNDGSDIKLASDVVLLLLEDGSIRLLHFGGNFYALSANSAEMLLAMLNQGYEAAVRSISDRYRVPGERVQCDLDGMLKTLEHQEIVYKVQPHVTRARGENSGRPNRFVQLLLTFIYQFTSSISARANWLMTVARISCATIGWSRTVCSWKSFHDTLGHHQSHNTSPEDTIAQIDKAILKVAARHILGMGCKERALACWSMMRARGLNVTLKVGVNLYPLSSHCWCEADSLILSDFEERCKRFTPIVEYT